MTVLICPNLGAGSTPTGGLVYKGSYNATTNTPDLTSSSKGDFYIVSVGGTLAGVTLNVGDHIVFNQNASSPITSSMFDVIDNTDAVASVNGQTGVVVLDSDDVSEGSTNQYFTDARADARADVRIGAADLTDLNDVSYTAGPGIDNYVLTYDNSTSSWGAEPAGSAPVTSVNTQTGAVVLDTDDISEGSTNLYYTDGRFDTRLAAKSTTDLSEGTNLYYTDGRFDTRLATKTTDDVSEGATNQYFTDARADARADVRIAAADLTDLNDVSYTAGPGIDNYVLTYDNSTSTWGAEVVPSAPVTSVNTQTGAVVLDTDDVSEGATNLYYTNARFDTQLATKSTTDLSEGTNLYFTDARADGRIGAADLTDLNDVSYTAGPGIDNYVLTYDNSTSTWGAEPAGSAPVTSVNTQTGAVSLDLDDVVTVGATTTTSITTGGLTVTGDIDPNADVTYYIGDENNRFISYYGDMNGAIRFKAKVDQAGGLTKGEVVYINGLSGTGNVPTVAKAQANSSSTMPAFGLVYASANDTADVEIITFGNLEGLVTNTFTAGTNLYVSSTTAGGLVNSAPTGESNLIQNIGFVVKSDATAGIIKVGGAGRTNATPNLDQDKIFLGNGSNQAVSTALSSVNLSSFNQDLTTSNVSEGTNLYYTDARFDTRLSAKSTTDLSEGTNLYFTDARADGRIGAADLTDLNDVSYTAGPGIDNYVLTFDNSTSTWGAEPSGTAPVTSVNTQTGAVVLDTDDISEGATNLYFTDARADARIGAADLTDLNDVSYTAGPGIDNYVLTFDNATSTWGAEPSAGGGGSAPTLTAASPSSNYTISTSTGIEEIYILTPSANISVFLPAASTCGSGYKYNIKNMSASNTLTIDPNLSETIDGSTTHVISNQYESLTLVTDGSNWFII